MSGVEYEGGAGKECFDFSSTTSSPLSPSSSAARNTPPREEEEAPRSPRPRSSSNPASVESSSTSDTSEYFQLLASSPQVPSPATSVATVLSLETSSPVPSPADSESSVASSACSADSLEFNGHRHEPASSHGRKRPLPLSAATNGDDAATSRAKRLCPPSSSSSSLSASASKPPMPKATHRDRFDPFLQSLFQRHVAASSHDELADLLRAHSESIDVDRYDEDGLTPLHHFCQEGQMSLVKLMVQYGANARLRTRDGWTTIHIASFSGNSEMLSYILECNRR